MAVVERSITLSCSAEKAFDFFARTENLHKLTPPSMQLEFLDAPDVLELGSRLEFRVQGFGLVQQLVHEVVLFDRPERFRERLVTGPLKHWVHDRLFDSAGAELVTITDRIEFEPPGGLLRFVVTESRLVKVFSEGYAFQHEQLRRFLE